MTQAELNRQVAQATGETVTTIRNLGFVPVRHAPQERAPMVVDWDELDSERPRIFPPSNGRAGN